MKFSIVKFSKICVSLVAVNLLLIGIIEAKIDPDTLIGVWLFDENSGNKAKDSSGNNNHGELKGAKWANGRFKTALGFGGDAHVNAGKLVLPENQITMVLWVSINTSKPWIHIIESGVVEFTWHGGFRLEVGGEGSTYIAIGDGVGYKDNAGNGLPTGWKYKKWFHLGFTYDGSTARHYQDGKQTHTFDSKLDITKGVGTLIFGSMQGKQRFLDGAIDDVAIFNAILSQDDIKTIMKTGLEGALDVSSSGKLATTWLYLKTQQ